MTYTVTVYQSGNSKVITIPAKLGLKVGEKLSLDVKDDGYILKRQLSVEEKLNQVRYIASQGIPGLTSGGLDDPQKLDEFLEGVYD